MSSNRKSRRAVHAAHKAQRVKLIGQVDQAQFQVLTHDGKSAEVSHAIFPIVAHNIDETLESVGTGFFIGQQGLFATAAHNISHVLDASGKPTKPLSIIHFLSDNQFLFRPVTYATRHQSADVAVGTAMGATHSKTGQPAPNLMFTLARTPPRLGAVISTVAFPKVEIRTGPPQEVHAWPSFFTGNVLHYYPVKRDDVMMRGPCLETSMVLHGGSSGGPAFDAVGKVVGINSTGYEDTAVSFVSCISSILDLTLPNIILPDRTAPQQTSIRELVSRGFVLAK